MALVQAQDVVVRALHKAWQFCLDLGLRHLISETPFSVRVC